MYPVIGANGSAPSGAATESAAESRRRVGAPAWIETALLYELDGGLWHATDERGFNGIVADRAIKPDAPSIYHNGFCRSIGAVSLFDLSRPDDAVPAAASHWSKWLGALEEEPRFWFEIDRKATAASVLDPAATLKRWRMALGEHSLSLRLIAGIEAAHVGPIPVTSTLRVLRLERGCWIRE